MIFMHMGERPLNDFSYEYFKGTDNYHSVHSNPKTPGFATTTSAPQQEDLLTPTTHVIHCIPGEVKRIVLLLTVVNGIRAPRVHPS